MSINLSKISTKAPSELNKKKIEAKTIDLVIKIGELQHKLYAEGKQSLLVILQGMDASGKDGTVKTVFADCNPSGIDVVAFKKPTEEEFAHDFLWRIHQKSPRKGNIMIFNRSHYEDILIQRVHKWISEDKAEKRMNAINAFEELLEFDANTKVLKFYMHISPEKQQEKLQERIDDTTKNWKHKAADWDENDHWNEYMRCYEYAINESVIPWHIAPADKRWYRNYFIAQVVLKTLEEMNPQLPILDRTDVGAK
ncbi:MAG TPA: PPK2 family polyphosphate kinase [Saprospiraceae bacterium]|nr:PPK2 family polyphosphate kinase [Saprospiraceae bacterium]